MPVRVTLMLAAFVAAVTSAAAQDAPQRPPQITVSGEATVSAAPDLAQLQVGVTTEGKTAREAAEANAKAMAAVTAAAKAAGIADRDMQTARYNIHPTYDTNRPRRDRIVGFQASNVLTLKVRQIDQLGEIIDRLTAAGANTVGGITFVVSEPSKLLDQARAQAIADARRKAQLYAQAAGVSLGAPLAIVEQLAGVQPPAPLMMARSADAAETPVAPGEQTLRVAVTVSYELQR